MLDKEGARKRYRKWYLNNPDKVRASRLKWKAAHPEKYKEISRAATLKWREKNPEKVQAMALRFKEGRRNIASHNVAYRQRNGLPDPTHGITTACECCGGPPGKKGLVLDHCHTTKEFRGWICTKCNLGLGALGDTAEGLCKALNYIAKYYKRSLQ